MADSKVSALTSLGATPASGDLLYIVDVSDTTDGANGTSKKVVYSDLITGLVTAGANSSITSLTGLTTPLTVAQGGTGAATLTGILKGSGTSAFTAVTAPSGTIVGTSDNQVLTNKTLTAPIIASISNSGTITVPTGTDTLVGKATTDTLTNKRITHRVNTVASSATPSINTDTTDMFTITALAVAITSMTTNLSGTPNNGDKLIIRILDNGSARAITWGASFASRGATLPTTTTLSKYTYVGLIWNSTASVWDCVAAVTEA